MKKSNLAIYRRKTLLKRFLIVAALVIVGVSFWYSSRLVRKLSAEERKKVSIWTDAIQRRAKLVNTTGKLFKELAEEERAKIELWTEATEAITTSDLQANNNFVVLALNIIQANHTIPIILTDQEGNIQEYKNIRELKGPVTGHYNQNATDSLAKINDAILDSLLAVMQHKGNRIDINYIGNQFIFLYYNDSYTLSELRKTFSDIENNFIAEVVSMAASTPVIYINQSRDSVIASNQVDSLILNNPELLQDQLDNMQSDNQPLTIDLGNGELQYVFYSDSELLTQLQYYPFIQFLAIGLFILIGYSLFSIFRRSEQDKVWVGMSKETAHQLGTPLSSLMGWIEVLRSDGVSESYLSEMEKDIHRLNMITDRFSKIGAIPNLKKEDVHKTIENFIDYYRSRSPKNVSIEINAAEGGNYIAPLNIPLFDWVVENLCKNAIDAMAGRGHITIDLSNENDKIIIDFTDDGKGMPANIQKNVFQPGFTSKERGWGLGLSLSKRIIDEYHNGKIFVKWTQVDSGSTFRIVLKP